MTLKNAYKLKDKNGKKLSKENRDSEGMLFVDNNLLISFERNPRVELYSKSGNFIKQFPINKKLRDIYNYKAPNKALEALAYNRKYGIVTAPERPFKNKKYHKLYAKKESWKFKINGSITALEFITENKLLVLERSFNHLTRARKIVLSIVNLESTQKILKSNIIAKFKSSDGWNLDNLEGLARVEKNKFLIISDDNDSFVQKTILVLFQIDGF